MYTIVKDVMGHINSNRISMLLRANRLPVSGTKDQLVERLEQAINGELGETSLTLNVLDDFLAEEISNGKSRMLLVSGFPNTLVRQMRDYRFVTNSLMSNGYPFAEFNILRTKMRPDETEMVYLEINKDDGGNVSLISMCFSKTVIIEGLMDEDGDELPPKYDTDYIWVNIYPEQEKIIIKIRPKANYFENQKKTKEVYEEISTMVRETFSLPPRSMEDKKNVLYKIFRDLTQTAEKPFRTKVEPLLDEIKKNSRDWAREIGLVNPSEPVNLPYRVFRLLERALIQQNFDEYREYFDGKRGIIERIAFSDPTGAHVNARSGHNDGIEMADIYFDTRDTIETLQKFDKLWVSWFYFEDGKEKPITIETKFEVFKEHYIIHFLYAYTTKEVEEHVLSNFEYYEKLPG